MKVLLACLYADFGQNGQMKPDFSNASWEYENVYKPWKRLADEGLIELQTHWVDTQSDPRGLERLISIAKDCDFVYQVPVTHALGIHLPQARQIIENGTPIVSFHPDIHMRYKHPAGDRFVNSRLVEGYDTHCLTPAKHMIDHLDADGHKTYLMPFGIPDSMDRQVVDGRRFGKTYPVTFVGQSHGIREKVISQMRGAGLEVHTWGHFWQDHPLHHGRPNTEEMVHIFNISAVNLNLRWCSRSPNHGQIKGRDLELMGCGAFMAATQHAETDDFHDIYTPDKEFVEAHFVHDLIDKVKYYIDHDNERQAIADAAYKKRQDNLWTTRYKQFIESEFWRT